MFEKVNPKHPDKVADRIAGAIVDLAYTKNDNPKVACEVLIGHNNCHIINETDTHITNDEVVAIVNRIAGECNVDYQEVKQDTHLAENQSNGLRCGDNGIFKGVPTNKEETILTKTAKMIYSFYPYDGKYIYNEKIDKLIVCQSNATSKDLHELLDEDFYFVAVNPLGDWTGGINVDSGATNRKLGSDMGRAVTGGGLHGKDLSKADVSVNIYAYLKAQETGKEVNLYCAIGDDTIDGKPYSEIVDIARKYINRIGGFEKLAEWGLLGNETR